MPTNFGANVVTGDVIAASHVNTLRSAVNTLEEASTFYAADTGTANAYVVSLSPTPTSPPPDGFIVRFKATNANTGASTLNLNGQGAVSIVRRDGSALATGDIKAGQVVEVVRKGTVWQLLSQDASGGVAVLDDLTDVTITSPADDQVLAYDSASTRWINQNAADAGLAGLTDLLPGFSNLMVQNDATTPASKVTVTADAVILSDSSNRGKIFRSVSVTLDITLSGAGGLDTGTEAASTTYFIWLVGKSDGTLSGVFSTSATAPTMPTGYTFKKLVSFVRNDASSNFLGFYQRDKIYKYDSIGSVEVFNSATVPTTATALDISAFVPPAISRLAILSCQINGSGDLMLLRGDSTDTSSGSAYFCSSGSPTAAEFLVGTDSSGNIKYFRTIATSTTIMRAIGCHLRI